MEKKQRLSLDERLLIQEGLTKLVFISLYAGGGGSSLGYEMSGLKELLAVEWDDHARKVFSANFPDVQVANLDISKLKGSELLKLIELKRGELDIFDASPPCQAFSMSNTNRDTTDTRNNLYFKTLELIQEVQPKLFVIENVAGMKMGKMKTVWNQIVERLSTMNYYVEFKVIRAEEHNVPQSRRRLIMIGLRRDIQKKFGTVNLFPKPDMDNVINMSVKKVLPNVLGFSPGQFDDKFITADKPMCTITKTASAWLYDFDGTRRKPTIAELKVLSSFPVDYKIFGSFTAQWARIGNAVPPNITKAIGLHIKTKILTNEVIAWCNKKTNGSDGKMSA